MIVAAPIPDAMQSVARPTSLSVRSNSSSNVPMMIALSAGLNITALLLPFMETKQLIFFQDVYTLPHSVKMMWTNGYYLLAAIILCFSIVFPFLKLGSLTVLWFMRFDDAERAKYLSVLGFLGKWYVFGAAIEAGYGWLAVVGAINAAISIFYYLRIAKTMFVADQDDDVTIVSSMPLNVTLALSAAVTLLGIVWATPFIEWVQSATLPF